MSIAKESMDPVRDDSRKDREQAPGSSADDTAGARPNRARRLLQILGEEVRGLHFRLRLAHMVLFFCPHYCFNRLRTAIYRLCGVHIGARSLVMGNIDLAGQGAVWKRLRIGENTHINAPLFADLNAEVTIGNNVSIGHHVVLITTNHDTQYPFRRCGISRYAPIVIGDGCWVGACSTILPGVTLGVGCVIAAGSVVASDVPPNMTAWGVPARPLSKLPTDGE